VFGVTPPRAAVLLRELLNAGSMIHSHAIHFFALAGPDLLLGPDTPAARRNLLGLLEAAPELTQKALRLRSIGQKIVEIVGGRGTHPVTAVAGGMSSPLTPGARATLRVMVQEAMELGELALSTGRQALARRQDLLGALALPTRDLGTVRDGNLDLYAGTLRVKAPDGSLDREFEAEAYAEHLVEEALPHSYGKQVLLRNPSGGSPLGYRVGPLARVNVADRIDTPRAGEALGEFKSTHGNPCHDPVLGHYARLIELVYSVEKAAQILEDDEVVSPDVLAKITEKPRSATAHVEAPRGVLIHDYQVDQNGIVQAANFVVATQHNIAAINSTLRTAAERLLGQGDQELLDGVEFAIRCYDPCLSCSTHQVGRMPMLVVVTRGGEVVREARR
jgi:coenzyme F420-reducing hydrogenase alpha subunit